MEIHKRKIEYSSRSKDFWIHIEPLSDIHIGSAFFDKVKFSQVINRIKNDPNRYTFIMGDIFDASLPGSKFYDEGVRDFKMPSFEDQYQFAVKSLYPIREKIIGIHTGNHDERIRKLMMGDSFSNAVLRLANDLRVKYLGYLALTKLSFQRRRSESRRGIDVFTAHGGYSGLRVGGNLNRVEDIASSFEADIYLTGHTHQIVVDKLVRLGLDPAGRIHERVQVFGVCGSFLRPYNIGAISYPEYKILRTTRVGTITVSINPYEGRIQAHE